MNVPKKANFGDVLGKWTKRESVTDGSLPFVAVVGVESPRSRLLKSSSANPQDDVGRLGSSFSKCVLKAPESDDTDSTEVMTESSTGSSTEASEKLHPTISPPKISPTESPPATKESKRSSLSDRIKKFGDGNVPSWVKKTAMASSEAKASKVSKKDTVVVASSTSPDPKKEVPSKTPAPSEPPKKKDVKRQKSMINHRLRIESRKKNRGKSVRRNNNKIFAHRITETTIFTPPVFEKDYVEKQLIYKALASNFVFEDLTPIEIKAFIQAFEKIRVHKGDVIIQQGDVGDYFYIIAHGEVNYEVNGVSVGSAGQGKSFGELALLYTSPRAASVIAAAEPTRLFRVDQRTFRYILQSQTKASEEEKFSLLKELPFLKDFVESDLHRLAAVMTPRKFEEDEYVVKKGEIGDAFYVLKEGEMKVTDISVGGTKYEDVKLESGAYFGERALLTSEPRAANVVGATSGTAFSIDRATFEKVLGCFSRVILKSQDRTKLEGLKVLKKAKLDSTKYDILASLILDKTFKAKEALFEEGKNTEPAVYLVREGNVEITSCDGSRKEVIEAGGYFGDEQLLADVRTDCSNHRTVTATYTATASGGKCICGVLLLADCRTVFDTQKLADKQAPIKKRASVPERGLLRRKSSMKVRNSLRSSIKNEVPLDSLNRKSVLGEGQFGEVWLVSAAVEEESESFALKIQSKENPDQASDYLDIIRREIDVVKSLDHPFIVDLVHSYETDNSIYMLLSLVEGGELWQVMHREDEEGNWSSGIPQEHAKFYSLVVADTLAYIHSENIIYRDLKPENILIDEDGYPVICDFGFAKICTDKTYTFCGTPNYLAPEIISNRGHGAGADHWALGTVIYEMIVGENPFFYEGLDQIALFEAICDEEFYPLPEDTSPDAIDLITGLLEKDPLQRLGMLAGRERDILQHRWFDDLDLVALQFQEVEAPWKPSLDNK